MANNPTTVTPEPDTAAGEPAFLGRARRILAGDVRPEDYLPVTPEVRRRVDLFMDWARARGNGQALAPEVEPRQLKEELLSFHHGGENVAYIEDEKGIVVLGVGLDQSSALIEAFPHELNRPIWFGAPESRF
jgi:hypothetical protein